MFIALVAYIGRSGYRDAAGDGVSFLDALYYASVSVTTTGYGDIAPAWRDVDPPVARTKRITLYTLREILGSGGCLFALRRALSSCEHSITHPLSERFAFASLWSRGLLCGPCLNLWIRLGP